MMTSMKDTMYTGGYTCYESVSTNHKCDIDFVIEDLYSSYILFWISESPFVLPTRDP